MVNTTWRSLAIRVLVESARGDRLTVVDAIAEKLEDEERRASQNSANRAQPAPAATKAKEPTPREHVTENREETARALFLEALELGQTLYDRDLINVGTSVGLTPTEARAVYATIPDTLKGKTSGRAAKLADAGDKPGAGAGRGDA